MAASPPATEARVASEYLVQVVIDQEMTTYSHQLASARQHVSVYRAMQTVVVQDVGVGA